MKQYSTPPTRVDARGLAKSGNSKFASNNSLLNEKQFGRVRTSMGTVIRAQ